MAIGLPPEQLQVPLRLQVQPACDLEKQAPLLHA